jgi:hypothetical protein
MDFKFVITNNEEVDGDNKVMTLEETDAEIYVEDFLRFCLSAMNMAGFTYIEEISANNGEYSTDDPQRRFP